MKSFTLAVAMLWLVGAINVAHAVPLFSYSSTINVATAPTVPSNPPGFGAAVIGIGAGNSLTFTTNAGPGDAGQPGGSAISIGDIIFNSSANSTPVNFGVNFDWLVSITDLASAISGDLHFTGEILGDALGNPASINASFAGLLLSPTSLVLGSNTYLIALDSATVPTGAGAANAGSVALLVSSPPPSAVPEPGMVPLLGLALASLAFARRRSTAPAGA